MDPSVMMMANETHPCSGHTSRNKQETDGSRHSTAPPGAKNVLYGFVFRKVRRILLQNSAAIKTKNQPNRSEGTKVMVV